MNEHHLTVLPVGEQKVITHEALRGLLRPQFIAEDVLHGLAWRLRAYVLADKVDEQEITLSTQIEVPASWWQHAKRDLFPTFSRWLRRPPRMDKRRITLTTKATAWLTFPRQHWTQNEPSLGAPVRFVLDEGTHR